MAPVIVKIKLNGVLIVAVATEEVCVAVRVGTMTLTLLVALKIFPTEEKQLLFENGSI